MNFRLPSLHLGTDFDRPPAALPVPGTASRGDSGALVILDGAARGARRLSRLVRRTALLGLEVERPSSDVRVTVTVLVDDLSTSMWRDAHRMEPEELPHEHRHHRLLRLSLQGRTRAAFILDRRPTDGDASVQRLSVRLAAEEIGESGLLTLALDVPGEPPAWLRPGLLEDGLAGVCVARVGVEPFDGGTVRPSLSTGRVPVNRRHLVPRFPGALVVNPGSGDLPVELRLLERVRVRRPVPQGLRARLKEPLARARDGFLRATRARSRDPLEVEVRPVDGGGDGGGGWTERATRRPDGSFVVQVPRTALPAYVRPVPTHEPSRRRGIDWFAWVREIEQ